MIKENVSETRPTVLGSTCQAAFAKMRPMPAKFSSIWARTSSGTNSAFSPIQVSISILAELKNVGKLTMNSRLCSIVGGINSTIEPVKTPAATRKMIPTAIPRLNPGRFSRHGIVRTITSLNGSKTYAINALNSIVSNTDPST